MSCIYTVFVYYCVITCMIHCHTARSRVAKSDFPPAPTWLFLHMLVESHPYPPVCHLPPEPIGRYLGNHILNQLYQTSKFLKDQRKLSHDGISMNVTIGKISNCKISACWQFKMFSPLVTSSLNVSALKNFFRVLLHVQTLWRLEMINSYSWCI